MTKPRGRTIAAILLFLVGLGILTVEHIWPKTSGGFTWIDVAIHSIIFASAGFLAYPDEVVPILKIVIERLIPKISFSHEEKVSPAAVQEAKQAVADAILDEHKVDVVNNPAVVVTEGKVIIPPAGPGGGE